MFLKDRVIVITGAAEGLGRGIAEVCVERGAQCLLADINSESMKQTAAALGPAAVPFACDVSSPLQLESLVRHCVDHFGRLDGLVNNAGVNFSKPYLDTTIDDWNRVIGINLTPVFVLTQLACRQMLAQAPPGGSIVNISSVHSIATLAGAGPYSAAKCGITGLTRAVAIEFAQRGIRVNSISPGLCDTAIWQATREAARDQDACDAYWYSNIPIGRPIQPREVGELAAYLLSDYSSGITGSDLVIDGGIVASLLSAVSYE
jgi:NAD(P)-dependent dehydrogenase (short-subunit alcohol dehydrogenase family)